MKLINTVAYVALVVLVTPIQIVFLVLKIALDMLQLLITISNGLINAFLFWLMPDHIKLEALARHVKAVAAKKDE